MDVKSDCLRQQRVQRRPEFLSKQSDCLAGEKCWKMHRATGRANIAAPKTRDCWRNAIKWKLWISFAASKFAFRSSECCCCEWRFYLFANENCLMSGYPWLMARAGWEFRLVNHLLIVVAKIASVSKREQWSRLALIEATPRNVGEGFLQNYSFGFLSSVERQQIDRLWKYWSLLKAVLLDWATLQLLQS